MEQHLIELSLGEAVQVGQYTVTLLSIEGDEFCIEIDGEEDYGIAQASELPEESLLESASQ